MRIIPIVLALILTVGCTTVKVQEDRTEGVKAVTTTPQLSIKTEKHHVDKKTKLIASPEAPKTKELSSIKKRPKKKNIQVAKVIKKDSVKNEPEVLTIPDQVVAIERESDYAPSELQMRVPIEETGAEDLSKMSYDPLVLMAIGASILLGLVAVFKLMKK